MNACELEKIRDIDRSEIIRTGYRIENGRLVRMDVEWDDGGWLEGDGGHSFGEMIGAAERYLELGGTAIGAFDGERLTGFAVYRPKLRPTMGQMAILHVSNGYRRRGIASRLYEQVLALARGDGATAFYVSATPSESAVGFYPRQGFVPTFEPDPELLAKEPEDIHMELWLQPVESSLVRGCEHRDKGAIRSEDGVVWHGPTDPSGMDSANRAPFSK